MKKFYRTAVIAAAGIAMLAGTWGSSVSVYAAEDTAAEEIIAEEEMADEFQESEAETTEMTDSVDSGSAAIQLSDGRSIASSVPDEMVPVQFHKEPVTIQGQTVEGVAFDNGDISLVYVTDSAGASYFMRYDGSIDSVVDFRMIPGPNSTYIMVMEPDDTVEAPMGYEKALLDWNGQSLTAFVNAELIAQSDTFAGHDAQPSDYFLIYGLSNNGRLGFYLYDQVEQTYQRYLDLMGAGVVASGSSDNKIIDFAAIKDGSTAALIRLIILIVMAVIIICLVVAVIILAVKLREYSGYEYVDEEEYNARTERAYQAAAEQKQSAPEPRNVRDVKVQTLEDEEETERALSQGAVKRTEPVKRTETVKKAEPVRKNESVRKAEPRRGHLLETGDIADLDDILNDPNSTSNLPSPMEIERAAARERAREQVKAAREEREKHEGDFANMQVTVDSFSAGMPAIVDTDMIAEDVGEVDLNNRTPSGRITGEMEFARDQYSEEQYQEGEYYYNDGYEGEDDDYYYGLSKKERKALEKQRRREEKEALKDAKYLEKERKKAEKRKKYGYDEPEAMDWSTFSDSMNSEEADERKPRGNNAETMPAYMAGRAIAEGSNPGSLGSEKAPKEQEPTKKKPLTEDERADAVIRAARGDSFEEEEEELSAREREYREYRQGARSQYEEFRRQDEEEAARREAIEQSGRAQAGRGASQAQRRPAPAQRPSEQERPAAPQRAAAPVQGRTAQGRPVQGSMQQPQRPQPPKKPEFTQDLDEDFEFEFLNIRRP